MTDPRSDSADLSAADPLGQQTRVAMLEPGVVVRVCSFESLYRSSHHRRHHHHHHLLLLLQSLHHAQRQPLVLFDVQGLCLSRGFQNLETRPALVVAHREKWMPKAIIFDVEEVTGQLLQDAAS